MQKLRKDLLESASPPTSIVDNLPSDLARSRILGTEDAAEFMNYSVPHFRRLYRAKKVPAPINISERKLGWRLGDLIDHVAALAHPEAA